MSSNLQIAPAVYLDLPEIAHIHVVSWQQTYVGQVPQAHLDNLDVTTGLRAWQEQFAKADVTFGLLLAKVDNIGVGFVCFGPGRDPDRPEFGEIYAIYVLHECCSCGIGHSLYKTACAALRDEGLAKAYLWVLDTNHQAITAYHRWGGVVEPDRSKDHTIGGQLVKEVSILFDPI